MSASITGVWGAQVGIVNRLNQPLSSLSVARWNAIAQDINALLRNTLAAAKGSVATMSTLRFLSIPGAIFTGLSTFFNALDTGREAFLSKDKECGVEAAVAAGLGCSFSLFGAAAAVPYVSALQKGFNQLGRAIVSGATPRGAVVALANGAGLAISVLVLILGLFGVQYVGQFRKEFAESIRDGNCYEFLRQQSAVATESKSGRAYEARVNAFKRRVGEVGYQAVLHNASNMIEIVDRESFKQVVKRVTLIAIGVLGVIAAFAPGVVIPSTLFAVTAVLWISIDSSYIHNKFGDWLYRYIGKLFLDSYLRVC